MGPCTRLPIHPCAKQRPNLLRMLRFAGWTMNETLIAHGKLSRVNVARLLWWSLAVAPQP